MFSFINYCYKQTSRVTSVCKVQLSEEVVTTIQTRSEARHCLHVMTWVTFVQLLTLTEHSFERPLAFLLVCTVITSILRMKHSPRVD